MSTQKPSKKSGNCRCSGGPPAEWFWEVILCLPDTAVRAESAKKHHPSGGVFGAGDEARTRFPASHEWLSPFAGALPHLRSNVLRTGRGSDFQCCGTFQKEYPILSDGVFFLERATRLELASRHPTNGSRHSQEPCLTSDQTCFAQVEAATSSAAAHSKKNTPSCRMGYSFWSGRRGSNSLPRPWQGRALPDELRPQTQD